MKTTSAKIERITPLTNSILQLILKPEQYIDYIAGQYLQIQLQKEVFSYSIANAPLGSHTYELHIRHSQDNPYSQSLLAEIKAKGSLQLTVPMGNCHIRNLDFEKPILFLAAGTGFAPIKAMIEHLLAQGSKLPFELFWGARSQSDLYMDERVHHWQTHVPQFQYFSHITSTSKETLASLAYKRHKHDIHDWQIVIAGPFDMVYSTRDFLMNHQINREIMFSDAFDFEKD
ncbi:FAD-binding oxidoreductase [Legionella impletisoli]|uniref:NAD(P)H-flavin reductase n=1 Tax=Legionella impletisoli TaxID=343510 RepID=A0A917JUG2_9GAMM|nr:FAD-binding oxidoreductase [Legionella impletisoli]GGI84886.1 NAD(P)H-flavin reductase [Legionella impletisoli]